MCKHQSRGMIGKMCFASPPLPPGGNKGDLTEIKRHEK